jgi:hypothetical protein
MSGSVTELMRELASLAVKPPVQPLGVSARSGSTDHQIRATPSKLHQMRVKIATFDTGPVNLSCRLVLEVFSHDHLVCQFLQLFVDPDRVTPASMATRA